jgi:hypothetical protein
MEAEEPATDRERGTGDGTPAEVGHDDGAPGDAVALSEEIDDPWPFQVVSHLTYHDEINRVIGQRQGSRAPARDPKASSVGEPGHRLVLLDPNWQDGNSALLPPLDGGGRKVGGSRAHIEQGESRTRDLVEHTRESISDRGPATEPTIGPGQVCQVDPYQSGISLGIVEQLCPAGMCLCRGEGEGHRSDSSVYPPR